MNESGYVSRGCRPNSSPTPQAFFAAPLHWPSVRRDHPLNHLAMLSPPTKEHKAPTRAQPGRDRKKAKYEAADFGEGPGTQCHEPRRWSIVKDPWTTAPVKNISKIRAAADMSATMKSLAKLVSRPSSAPAIVSGTLPKTFNFGPHAGVGAGFYDTEASTIYRNGAGSLVWGLVEEVAPTDADKSGKKRHGEVYHTLVELVNTYVLANQSSRIDAQLLCVFYVNGDMIQTYGMLTNPNITIPWCLLNPHCWFKCVGWRGLLMTNAIVSHAVPERPAVLDAAVRAPFTSEPKDRDGAFILGTLVVDANLNITEVIMWDDAIDTSFAKLQGNDANNYAQVSGPVTPYDPFTASRDDPPYWRAAVIKTKTGIVIVPAPEGVAALQPKTRVAVHWRLPKDVELAAPILEVPRERRSYLARRFWFRPSRPRPLRGRLPRAQGGSARGSRRLPAAAAGHVKGSTRRHRAKAHAAAARRVARREAPRHGGGTGGGCSGSRKDGSDGDRSRAAACNGSRLRSSCGRRASQRHAVTSRERLLLPLLLHSVAVHRDQCLNTSHVPNSRRTAHSQRGRAARRLLRGRGRGDIGVRQWRPRELPVLGLGLRWSAKDRRHHPARKCER